MKTCLNKKLIVTTIIASISLAACNNGSGTATGTGAGALTQRSSNQLAATTGTLTFNFPQIGLKATSSSRQEITLGLKGSSGVTNLSVKITVKDSSIANFYKSTGDCIFSDANNSCKVTVAGVNPGSTQLVATVSDPQLANTYTITPTEIKVSAATPTPAPTPTPTPTSQYGEISFDKSGISMNGIGQTTTLKLSLKNSPVSDNNVTLNLGLDNSNGIVKLDRDNCNLTKSIPDCEIKVTSLKYGQVAIQVNERKQIIDNNGKYTYSPVMVVGVNVQDPNSKTDSISNKYVLSTVYPEYNSTGDKVSFIVRGATLSGVQSLNGDFMKSVMNSIRQADPIAFDKDFSIGANGQTFRFVDVIVGDGNDNEAKLFANLSGETELKNKYDGNKGMPMTPAIEHSTAFTDIDNTTYNVITQIAFHDNPQSDTKLTNTRRLINEEMYNDARKTNIPTIYYIHCAQGMDRTGFTSAWYLLHSYLAKAGATTSETNAKAEVAEVLHYGLVKWSGDSNIFKQKDWQYSNVMPSFPVIFSKYETTATNSNYAAPYSFINTDSWWNSVIAASSTAMKSDWGTPPAADAYAWNKPLEINLNNNTVTVKNHVNYNNIYVAYADVNGVTIKNTQGNYVYQVGNQSSFSLANKPANAVTAKIYALNSNAKDTFYKEKVGILNLK